MLRDALRRRSWNILPLTLARRQAVRHACLVTERQTIAVEYEFSEARGFGVGIQDLGGDVMTESPPAPQNLDWRPRSFALALENRMSVQPSQGSSRSRAKPF
jgi:hypothetical protein